MGNKISSQSRTEGNVPSGFRRLIPPHFNRPEPEDDQVALLLDSPTGAAEDISFFLRIWVRCMYRQESGESSRDVMLFQDHVIMNSNVQRRGLTKRILHIVAYDPQKNKVLDIIILRGTLQGNIPTSKYFIFMKKPNQSFTTLIELTTPSDEPPAKEWSNDLLKVEFCAENIYTGCNTKSIKFTNDVIELSLDSFIKDTTEGLYHVTEFNPLLDKTSEIVVVKGNNVNSSPSSLHCEDLLLGETWDVDFDGWIFPQQLEGCPPKILSTVVTLAQCCDILYEV